MNINEEAGNIEILSHVYNFQNAVNILKYNRQPIKSKKKSRKGHDLTNQFYNECYYLQATHATSCSQPVTPVCVHSLVVLRYRSFT